MYTRVWWNQHAFSVYLWLSLTLRLFKLMAHDGSPECAVVRRTQWPKGYLEPVPGRAFHPRRTDDNAEDLRSLQKRRDIEFAKKSYESHILLSDAGASSRDPELPCANIRVSVIGCDRNGEVVLNSVCRRKLRARLNWIRDTGEDMFEAAVQVDDQHDALKGARKSHLLVGCGSHIGLETKGKTPCEGRYDVTLYPPVPVIQDI